MAELHACCKAVPSACRAGYEWDCAVLGPCVRSPRQGSGELLPCPVVSDCR